MMHPLLGMAVVLLALGALLGCLTLCRRWAAPHPELLRKLLHAGMGLVTLSFPWLFDDVWPVLILALFSIILLASLRLISPLKSSVGQVVGGVARSSLGEIYFPMAVAILWVFYVYGPAEGRAQQRLLYLIPLLLLTVSDALAALVGVAYGGHPYDTPDGSKSVEGSVAFFLSAFLCCHVPLLLLGERDRPETLLIAALLALLAMMFEAIAWAGLDNLILPLVAHLLLGIYWDLHAGALLMRLGVTLGFLVFALFFSRWATLVGSAVLGAVLVGYICWALGGWAWTVPPLLLYVGYTFVSPATELNSQKTHSMHAVVSVSAAGMIWLFLAQLQGRPEWFFPFTCGIRSAARDDLLDPAVFRSPVAARDETPVDRHHPRLAGDPGGVRATRTGSSSCVSTGCGGTGRGGRRHLWVLLHAT